MGIAVAIVALPIHFLDDDLAAMLDADDRAGVDRVAQAMGIAAIVAGLVGLWRKEVEFVCGATMVLGTVAIFFEFFVFVAFAAAIIGVAVVLFRTLAGR